MYICNNLNGFTQCIQLSLYKPEWGQSPTGPCKVYRILIIMLAMRQKDLLCVYMLKPGLICVVVKYLS